ncbi:MAG: cryptochrome/photolyase family protein [Planctomycetota bacterium]|jgi:deoxyribodipyrimidine photolyase-related protein
MPKGFIILPNQLFKSLPARKTVQVVLVEALGLFLDYRFHKKKLIFHRASLKYYQSFLEQKKYKVHYLDYQTLSKPTGLGGWLKKKKINQVSLYDPVDKNLETQLKKEFDRAKIVYEFLSCPLFLCQEPDLKNFFSDKEHYSMNSFYISQRKRLEILLDSGKPRGGKWSFDKENRQKLGKDVKVPGIHPPASNKFVREAKEYVSSCFPDNPGSTENFFYPVTHKDAEKWLEDFIEKRLDGFGPYEDAISVDQSFLFHSLLSPLLNSGLLTPQEVLKGIIDYSQQNDIRFNSLEGFVRQVVGWREFLRAVYTLQGQKQKESNFWGFKHKLPPQFYDATTGIDPVDHIIKRVLTNAYAHHIERLMVLGNFMLLCEIAPKEVYRWFMELFIDAYEWVMVPNIFGMSQYADGGMITTKPYISSSNYIRKMSDFKPGPWCDIWDSLFWRFIHTHKKVFAKMDSCIQKAEAYLKTIHEK